MLQLLLAHDVNPNDETNGHSDWLFIIQRLMIANEKSRAQSFEAIELLLRHGADFELKFTHFLRTKEGKPKRETRAKELLKEWYDENQYGVLEAIVKRRASKPKKGQQLTKMRSLKLWIASKK